MYKQDLEDTIVAISTPLGQGGIGIVRLSGKKAVSIADRIFVTKKEIKPSQFKSYTAHYGWVVRKSKIKNQKSKLGETNHESRATSDAIIDEALLMVMRAPKSYTKEDVVEISCHGGLVPLRMILNLTIDLGARPAEPGEFTKRAFLNGRMDLTQAEAVLDIIQAKTDAFLKVSLSQLKGELTVELEAIRDTLMRTYTQIEAIVNFPEDDIDVTGRTKLKDQIASAHTRVKELLESSDQGRILKEGIKVVLCGKPNVGKSSLLNVLLRQPRAIVTDIAGTTRVTIEETTQIKGIPFQVVDTAGILQPRDLIEEEAVKRSHLYIENADLALFLLDATSDISHEDEGLIAKVKDKNILVVINKCDLPMTINEGRVRDIFQRNKILKISALKRIAIDELEGAIVDNVWQGKTLDVSRVLVSNARHISSLKNCDSALRNAQDALRDNAPLEIVSEEIKSAVNHLDTITGRNITGDLLDRIFSEFCIGK